MNIFGIFLFVASVMVANVSGSLMESSTDQWLINEEQYSSFSECQAAGVEIHEAMMANKSMKNIPSRTITEDDVFFALYTWKNNIKPQILPIDANKISSSNFDVSKQTVLYVHPLAQKYNVGTLYFTKILLRRKNINLIITNWDSYTFYDFMYSRNVTTPILAKIVGKFVQTLINVGADSKTIHMIGFSAGAQTVGLAGKMISPKVGRISAFDPQGSCFNFLPPDLRISTLDADYVVIVHCTVGDHGMPLNITGDSTFYMNGGLQQPYCNRLSSIRQKCDCSHMMCEFYLYQFLEISSPLKGYKCNSYDDYLAHKCDFTDTATLTYNMATTITGMYFVDTVP